MCVSLYSLAHRIQNGMPWMWDMVEWCNSLFFSLRYRKEMKSIPSLLRKRQNQIAFREVREEDIETLTLFFSRQPQDAFAFFHPHGFDQKSLAKLARRKSFLMFEATEGDAIVGYFFLRCYVNGNGFWGYMVDYHKRNRGIGKQMGRVVKDIVLHMGLRLFASISPDNYSSLALVGAVYGTRVIRILENGYYYIECTPKKELNCNDKK